jgi:hypothetical protein
MAQEMISLSHVESIPVILSLIRVGHMEQAYSQLRHMAALADGFGRDVEALVISDKDAFTVQLRADDVPQVIQEWSKGDLEEVENLLAELQDAYPNLAVVYR